MRVSILCPDEYIEEVRSTARELISSHIALTTPLSHTGDLPQTHWFCTCYLTDQGIKKFHELKKYTTIYTGNPKVILKELELRIVK